MSEKLNSGADFPALSFSLAGGGGMTVPADLDGEYTFAVIYRAHW